VERNELVEWIVIVLVIVAWWPRIFFGYDPLWYHLLIYYISPIVLVVILVVRYRRVREGFEYSEQVIRAQHKAAGREMLGTPKQREETALPWMTPPGDEANKGEDQGKRQ